ncbi:TRAP transporter substrate-binding protein [Peptoniphilus catoniae]|uniref:TRAP transporter substrate-binding protein n=1 Tax=Peptoniphilus catoniae TaxID=1660341 RepID=UPI0010FE11EB|nr:TRAP transporter substrate-binding protein [Peptoniphilus catoniae]
MKKKLLLLVLALTFVLTACGGNKGGENKAQENGKNAETQETTQATGDSVVIKIGHVEPEDRSTHQALLEFKKNVEERSKGSLTIEIYPNGALGGDVQITESVAMGTLDAALPATSVLTTYSEEFGILDMPYLFKSSDAAFAALDGKVGEYFNAKLEENGIHNLGYSYNGPRSTTTNTGPIEKPEDLKGVKMRVMESPIFIDFYKTLGANPTPMSFTELYTGLQQGTVEAQENPPSLTFANKFYEVQKYQTIDEHVHNFLAFIMNANKFNSLTDEQKTIITEEGKNYVDTQRKMELEANGKAIENLKTEGGLETNILSPEQKQAFRDAVQPMYDKYHKQFGEDLFNMCEEYNK